MQRVGEALDARVADVAPVEEGEQVEQGEHGDETQVHLAQDLLGIDVGEVGVLFRVVATGIDDAAFFGCRRRGGARGGVPVKGGGFFVVHDGRAEVVDAGERAGKGRWEGRGLRTSRVREWAGIWMVALTEFALDRGTGDLHCPGVWIWGRMVLS